MKAIILTHGMVAFVDDEDYERASSIKWHAKKAGRLWYAHGRIRGPKVQPAILLHRYILNLPPNLPHVDHRDGDGLNCQKYNLRIATRSQQSANRKLWGSSPYKGVRRDPKGIVRPWRARIQVGHRRWELGFFATAEDAAKAYDLEARRHFGEFARTNF
jgi:AP2 domain